MVFHGQSPFLEINHRLDGVAGPEDASLYFHVVADRSAAVLRVGHARTRFSREQESGIADLSPRFGVKWGEVENNLALLALRYNISFLALDQDCAYAAPDRLAAPIPDEGGLSLEDRFGDLLAHLSCMIVLARALALLFQGAVEPFFVHDEAVLLSQVFDDLQWQAPSVV